MGGSEENIMENTRTEKEIQDINIAVFIDTVDKILGKELNTKQAKKIIRQIKRLERKISTRESGKVLITNSLCDMLGWKENTEYIVGNRRYKISDNILYYKDPMLNVCVWQENKGQLSKFDKFFNAKEISENYHLYNEELGDYGYLNVVDFKNDEEKILFDGNKKIFGIRNIFTEDECNYLKSKYKSANLCERIDVL